MAEEREHLQKLIELHRSKLQHYEELEAKYGLDCPVYVKNAKEEARKGLAEARTKLTALEGGASDAEPSIPAIPQNLPPRGEFIGREREMEQVRQALASRSYLVVIEGIGGIGKTVLALEVAHELWEKGLYEAVVWTTAKDRELDLNDILDTFARTVDYPYIAQLPPEEKPTEAAKLMRAKKCLLLLDNFETIKDEAVSEFLLNLPEPSKALITSRHHAPGEARTIPLRSMEQCEALALMRAEGGRLGLESVQQAGDEILLRLYQATGGAPLAIKWAVGQIKQKGQSLDSVLDSLYGARGDLFEFMFSRSWEMLSEDARRILMVMPIFATSASRKAIEAASDVHTWDLNEGLGQLVEMSLVEVSSRLEEQQRYSVHPLVRAFAGAKLGKEPLKMDFESRAANYFLRWAEMYGGEDRCRYDELESERENILAMIGWFYNTGKWRAVVECVELMGHFLNRRGYWYDCLEYGRIAIEASKKLDDKQACARLTIFALGWTRLLMGYREEAERLTRKGLGISKEAAYPRGIAIALRNLGVIALRQGELEKAKRLVEEDLEIWQRIGDLRWISRAKGTLGYVALNQRDYKSAKQHFEEGLRIGREIADNSEIASHMRRLGHVAKEQGDLEKAKQFYLEALQLKEKTGEILPIANNKLSISWIEEVQGNYTLAFSLARQALEVYERLGNKRRVEETQTLIARLGRATEQDDSTMVEQN
jgi:tetratricopeptide (TPR) repeat protein